MATLVLHHCNGRLLIGKIFPVLKGFHFFCGYFVFPVSFIETNFIRAELYIFAGKTFKGGVLKAGQTTLKNSYVMAYFSILRYKVGFMC